MECDNFNHYTESWFEKGKTFSVEVRHWTSNGGFRGSEFGKDVVVNHWNVYVHIFKKHPFFEMLNEKGDNYPFLNALHYGCTYTHFDRDKHGTVESKHFGSDYAHLHDEHYAHVSERTDAREIFLDAECLFLDFKEIEDEKIND